jgi:hypothetical protein
MWNSGVQPSRHSPHVVTDSLNVAKGFVFENRKTTRNVHTMLFRYVCGERQIIVGHRLSRTALFNLVSILHM